MRHLPFLHLLGSTRAPLRRVSLPQVFRVGVTVWETCLSKRDTCRGIESAEWGSRSVRLAGAEPEPLGEGTCSQACSVAVAGDGGRICPNRSSGAENAGASKCRANVSDDANFCLCQRSLVPVVSELLEYRFVISLCDKQLSARCVGAGKLRRGMNSEWGPPLASCVTSSYLTSLLLLSHIYKMRIIISTLQGCCQKLKCLAIIGKGTARLHLNLLPCGRFPIGTAA